MITPIKTWYRSSVLWGAVLIIVAGFIWGVIEFRERDDKIQILESAQEEMQVQLRQAQENIAKGNREIAKLSKELDLARAVRDKTAAQLQSEEARASQAREQLQSEVARVRRAENLAATYERGRREAENQLQETRRNVWSLAVIRNETNSEIPFQLRFGNAQREDHTLTPRQEIVLWRRSESMSIAFDGSLKDGYQGKLYSLRSINVVNREPDDLDKRRAPVHFFSINDADINLYVRPN